MGNVTLLQGDCLDLLPTLADASLDACVCDPPYELGFMGRAWDCTGIAYNVTLWRDVYRVLKPGAHLVAFGGTRTYHRLVCAIEDAGFEIRDQLNWVYGSGFPKSHDVSKALDKAAGAARKVIGRQQGARNGNGTNNDYGAFASAGDGWHDITAPATDLAAEWAGWGTALKPSHEPIVLARKPLIGTVAANVAAHGTGALNIDACRVGAQGGTTKGNPPKGKSNGIYGDGINGACEIIDINAGRWPPNLLLTHAPTCNGTCAPECPIAELDRQSGLKNGAHSVGKLARQYTYAQTNAVPNDQPFDYGDTGGASRFYPTFRYVPKASRRERNAGCDGLPEAQSVDSDWVSASRKDAPSGGVTTPQANHHPTVKPVALLLWLVRLVTPPGGTVLDPFMGSGSAGIACVQGGFGYVGMEREAEYLPICQARIAAAQAAYQPALLEAAP